MPFLSIDHLPPRGKVTSNLIGYIAKITWEIVQKYIMNGQNEGMSFGR